MMMEIRSAARLLVFDANRRLLLFLHTDGHGRQFWATPGGGIEPGETPEEAALRESAEELGNREVDLAQLWTGQSDFLFANRTVSQTETFFLVTPRSGILGPEVREVHRLEGITEVRWWSLEEIENCEEALFPTDLADRLKERLREDL